MALYIQYGLDAAGLLLAIWRMQHLLQIALACAAILNSFGQLILCAETVQPQTEITKVFVVSADQNHFLQSKASELYFEVHAKDF